MPGHMPHSLLNKMHAYKAQPQFYPWHVKFQVLNNLENAASLNNLLQQERFQSAPKWKTRGIYLTEPNSTSFIETRHIKLDKAVCIYAVLSHT